MDTLAYNPSYRRHLPHYQLPGATLFITFRLANSLPVEVVKRLIDGFKYKERMIGQIPDSSERDRQMDLAERLHFGEWENALDTSNVGPSFLKDPRFAAQFAKFAK